MQKLFFTAFILLTLIVSAQKTTVTGKVTEAETNAPVPFATVVFAGTSEGAITDFDGNFTASTSLPVDSVFVTYIGFVKKVKPLTRGATQTINFQLKEDVTTLQEVVVTPGENPAFPIMRNVIENKKLHDKRELEAYEYESYIRTEFDLDNISEEMRERRFMKKIMTVMDSVDQLAGEDGKPILPMMISEAISRYYFRKSPYAKHEDMIKTKVTGVGITDGTTTSQLLGSTYQEYNFYQNWLNIVGKEFASPLVNSWKLIYEYELVDSVYVGKDFCYKLEFFPKQELDLAFKGTMWITKEGYALKQIDAYVPNTSNLNFLDKIKIQQELSPTIAGPWLPTKTRVIVDFKPITEKTAGILAKFYVSNKDFLVNQPKPNDFYINPVSLDPDVRNSDDHYWAQNRHDTLTSTEISVYSMIDTLKQLPVVKNTTQAIRIVASGFVKTGPVDIGPYTTFFGNNNIEGIRLGMGVRTNINFSNKWTIGGYTGYGLDDERWKYTGYVNFIVDRNLWTELRYQQQREIDQIWLLNENIDASSLFYSFSRFGTLTQPFLKNKSRLVFIRQLGQGLNIEVSAKHEDLKPLFEFGYFPEEGDAQTKTNYSVSEATFILRYGRDEIMIIDDNRRVNLGPIRLPVYNLSYTYGSDRLAADFNYHKVKASIEKRQKIGFLGVSRIELGGGFVVGRVPYTILFNTIGNETPAYASFAYNQMDFFEFSSERFVELKYRHSFEGFIMNRIPLMKKLKWRLIASANILQGEISDEIIQVTNFELDSEGNQILPFRRWENKPYVEVGYGVENILKVLTVQAFHRLTYLDANASKFGIKFSFSLNL